MLLNDYQQRIADYYRDTENAYKDSWDLNNSLSIHYGYWDDKVRSFPQSLIRMNEIMAEAATIKAGDYVLDAGCGVGGSSIFLAKNIGAKVMGITLSQRQAEQANKNAVTNGVENSVQFELRNYSDTDLPANSFDVTWGCESICYAENKEQFIREAFRLLRPGGRLVVADGFVTDFKNNENLIIRKWLDGWQVNYLETPERFLEYAKNAGFRDMSYRDISKATVHSSRRLYKVYYLAKMYLLWKKINFSKPATLMQKKNIEACKYQFIGMKTKLWQYGLFTAVKPG
ncbi:MAG: methyltransferase domain-containing protein [Chitinophagaceae bacterium]|nr:methyltransferase domain-containing protein [Chitinophagaceae bacterium]